MIFDLRWLDEGGGPDISPNSLDHVAGNLYQGSIAANMEGGIVPAGMPHAGARFVLHSGHCSISPFAGSADQILWYPFKDKRFESLPEARHVANMAWEWSRFVVDYADSGPVLVTCHMGANRSGLITALSLLRLGFDADEAIRLIRDARGSFALSNESFVEVIRAIDAELPVK